MFNRLFRDHPRSVGETYFQHFHAATGFGVAMTLGGLACLVHAIFPFLFVSMGSRTVERLNRSMVSGRRGRGKDDGTAAAHPAIE